jgi:hypothetical protein
MVRFCVTLLAVLATVSMVHANDVATDTFAKEISRPESVIFVSTSTEDTDSVKFQRFTLGRRFGPFDGPTIPRTQPLPVGCLQHFLAARLAQMDVRFADLYFRLSTAKQAALEHIGASSTPLEEHNDHEKKTPATTLHEERPSKTPLPLKKLTMRDVVPWNSAETTTFPLHWDHQEHHSQHHERGQHMQQEGQREPHAGMDVFSTHVDDGSKFADGYEGSIEPYMDASRVHDMMLPLPMMLTMMTDGQLHRPEQPPATGYVPRLFNQDGSLNLGVVTFAALCAACGAVYMALLVHVRDAYFGAMPRGIAEEGLAEYEALVDGNGKKETEEFHHQNEVHVILAKHFVDT